MKKFLVLGLVVASLVGCGSSSDGGSTTPEPEPMGWVMIEDDTYNLAEHWEYQDNGVLVDMNIPLLDNDFTISDSNLYTYEYGLDETLTYSVYDTNEYGNEDKRFTEIKQNADSYHIMTDFQGAFHDTRGYTYFHESLTVTVREDGSASLTVRSRIEDNYTTLTCSTDDLVNDNGITCDDGRFISIDVINNIVNDFDASLMQVASTDYINLVKNIK